MSTLDVPTGWVSRVLQTRRILDLVATAQQSSPRVPVLIRGETGVGKDVVARLIHATSARQPYAFIKVNCRALALDPCGDDLFGQARGSGPQMLRRRPGSVEYASHGTIYLDEIAALPLGLVAALDRVLRTGEILTADGQMVTRVDVRVIASTALSAETGDHAELWQELRRLNTVEISLPPLRERMDEIAKFASFFAEQFRRRYLLDVELCPEVIASLSRRSWTGNIRELEDTVHRLVLYGRHGSGELAAPVVAP